MVDVTKVLFFADRSSWRDWLENNHASEKDIWLTFYKKHTGKKGLCLDEAVEEALCFGWIDSTLKRVDGEMYILRFSPRRKGGVWARTNIERIDRLVEEGKMTKAGLESMKGMKRDTIASMKELMVPNYVAKALKKDNEAWNDFNELSPSHKKQYVWWIMSAKKKETRNKRIERTIKLLKSGKG
jgi:uncharacterized protein YdeI (YjbR/CyaY-like superfamily)